MKKAVYVELKDKRYEYVLQQLEDEGFASFALGEEALYPDYQKIYVMSLLFEVKKELALRLENNSYLFSNTLSDEVKQIIEEKQIIHINMLEDETFLFKNAYVTAEGALSYIIMNTPTTLYDMPILVLGYGRVGKSVVKMLRDNYALLSVATDDASEQAQASISAEKVYNLNNFTEKLDYAAIVNTIPKLILKGERMELINKDCFILDLASKPGGVDFDYAKSLGINCLHALGVPGKVAPKTAGLYIKDVIMKGLKINYEK